MNGTPLPDRVGENSSLQVIEAELREIHVTLRLQVILLVIIVCLLAVITYVVWPWRWT